MPRWPLRSATRAASIIPGRSTRSGTSTRSSAGSTKTRISRIMTDGRSPGSMERGLYIAASGMLAEQVRQDQIANDLANASTPGYKADTSVQSSFGQVLLSNTATGQVVGPMSLGVHISQEVTDLTQGPLQQTGNPLDFALDGAGFFTVETHNGTAYTRDGQFEVDGGGRLITDTGNPVLGTDGKPIVVGNAKNLAVSADGVVTSNGKQVGQLN